VVVMVMTTVMTVMMVVMMLLRMPQLTDQISPCEAKLLPRARSSGASWTDLSS
jgi:hypothetical protein